VWSESIWVCPCNQKPLIQIANNTKGHFDAMVQYYIDKPKEVIPYENGTPTANELYNEQIKRLDVIKDIMMIPAGSVEDGVLHIPASVSDFILFIFMLLVILVILIVGVIVVIYVYSERIKRWLNMDKDEKLSFKKVLVAIFRRPNVSRKSIGKRDKDFEAKRVQQQVKEPEKIKSTPTAEDEVRKILEELNQEKS
jgi:uncharacterized membrane protein